MNLWKRLIHTLQNLGWSNILRISALLFFIGIVVTLLVFVFIPDSPVEAVLYDFLEWLDEIPVIWGSLLMFGVQTMAIILMLPGTPFNLACGFLFDVWIGSLVSVASADVAATVSFLVVRIFARGWAAEQIEKRPKFKAIDKAVGIHGMWLIALIRISPILPFGLCNYMLGLTNVPFWKYWISSTIGLAPYTIAYAYLGSLLRGLADVFNSDSDSTESIILLSVGGGATIITIVAVALVTKRALSRVVVEEPQQDDEEAKADAYVPVLEDEEPRIEVERKEVTVKETTPLVSRRASD